MKINIIIFKNLISFFNIFLIFKKKKYNKKNIKKILYISVGNSGIGDILMQFPTFFLLNKHFKNTQIDFLLPNSSKFLFENYISKNNNFYFKGDNFKKLIKKLNNNNYDLIISNHWLSSFYSNLISINSFKIGYFTDFGFKDNFGKVIQSNFKIEKFKQIEDDRIGKFLLLLYSFKVITKKELFEFRNDYSLSSDYSINILNKIIKKSKKDFIIENKINIIFYMKHNNYINKFGLSKYFLNKIYYKLNSKKLNFIVIGPSYDSKSFIDLKEDNIKNAKDLSWGETLYILKKSDLIIAEDSSIFHLSLLLLKNVIGIFPYTINYLNRVPNNKIEDMIYINNIFIKNDYTIKNLKFILYEDYLIEIICNKIKIHISNNK